MEVIHVSLKLNLHKTEGSDLDQTCTYHAGDLFEHVLQLARKRYTPIFCNVGSTPKALNWTGRPMYSADSLDVENGTS